MIERLCVLLFVVGIFGIVGLVATSFLVGRLQAIAP